VLPAFRYALVDLNNDGVLDAVVLMTEGEYCGSGGCLMVVLRGASSRFKVISWNTLSREPVSVLPETSHGWHTLTVKIAGGGVEPGSVLMRFDGRRYPSNPSLVPRAGPKALEAGAVLSFVQ